MKLVGYIRVSTDAQAENTSLTEQRKRIESYCYAFGHELVAVFEEIGSGKNMSRRPQFQEALRAVEESADGIIAVKLDRIARNARDVLELVEDTLQPTNKALVLLDLQVDTSTPTGRMILTVMASVAQLEREVINERTQRGRKAKSAQGGYAYGSPQFGQKALDGQLITDETEQAVIELIRKHKRSGKSDRAVALWLNGEGYQTKQGKQWTGVQVARVYSRVIKNP